MGTNVAGPMSPKWLTTNTGTLTNKPSKFGLDLINNIRDVASFVFIKYRDPKNKIKFANPVVDIAASIWIGVLFG